MDKIAVAPASDRRDLFTAAAGRLGMNPAIIEKDFWVCWILKRLFSEPRRKDQMVFKGGTSLSKVYGLIDRFSEDIDLVLDWRLLGYGIQEGVGRESAAVSRTRQSRFKKPPDNDGLADRRRPPRAGKEWWRRRFRNPSRRTAALTYSCRNNPSRRPEGAARS